MDNFNKKIFLVGGSVRDKLLKLEPKDKDYVVVGSTPEEMMSLGFKKVGADFPVFLHPETGDEYALARKERSTGKGYHDFEVDFSPNITLMEDLERRDFTINSIAMDEEGNLYHPRTAVDDIKNRVLRATNRYAFSDDPVRVLRLARFAARYPAFSIESHTFCLAENTDIKKCSADRVGLEMMKALMSIKPSKFFDTLRDLGQLKFWFPEIHKLIGVPQPIRWHAEGDAYTHTMMVLDGAAKYNEPLEVRFGALVHDLGKGETPEDVLPSHKMHEIRGVPLVKKFCERLKINNTLNRIGQKVSEFHTHVHHVTELRDKTFVKTFNAMKNHPEDITYVANVAFYDNYGKLPTSPYCGRDELFIRMTNAANQKLSDWYGPEEIEKMNVNQRKSNFNTCQITGVKMERSRNF